MKKLLILFVFLAFASTAGIAYAADLNIASAADMTTYCSHNAATRTYNCSADASGNIWDNIYITSDLTVPRDGGSCNTNSANVIFRAKNDFIANNIYAWGTQGYCSGYWIGSGGFVDISAKKIQASSIYSRGYVGSIDDGSAAGANINLKGDTINITGPVQLQGGTAWPAAAFSGGTLTVSGGVVILGDINANGGSGRVGAPSGNIYINATSAKVKSISANPGRSDSDAGNKLNGGTIMITSAYFESGAITANGAYGQYGGDGGIISINAIDVNITGAVTLNGYSAGSRPRPGGAGGRASIIADNSIYLASLSVAASTGASCGSGGAGGNIFLDSKNVDVGGALSANGGAGGSSSSSGCNAASGGRGGTINVNSRFLNLSSLAANGGTGGAGTYYSNGGTGGAGGVIKINAVETEIESQVTALGGLGGRLTINAYTSGVGGAGGTITIVGDTKLNITQPVSVAGGNGGPSFTEASGGAGGPGGKLFVYASDPATISSLIAIGGNGAGKPADRSCGSGGAGGKVLVFTDASSTIGEFSIDINGGQPGVPDTTYKCTLGSVGVAGRKAKYPRSVESAFRMISTIKERITGNNLTGSIQARIFDNVAMHYNYNLGAYTTWQPYASVYSSKLNSLLGMQAPTRVLLGRVYTMEVTISDKSFFDYNDCDLGLATCNTLFIDFVEYYETV